jgi:hypothetical protein
MSFELQWLLSCALFNNKQPGTSTLLQAVTAALASIQVSDYMQKRKVQHIDHLARLPVNQVTLLAYL